MSNALVVGADVMSSIIDYSDRATCVPFGDGAGAVVLAPADDGEPHILDFAHQIDGAGAAALIDRLVHHCHIVPIRGNSYRMRQHTDLWHALHTPDPDPPSNRRRRPRQEATTN